MAASRPSTTWSPIRPSPPRRDSGHHRHPRLHYRARKAHATGRKGIFLIDAAKGFQKDGNKNRLRQRDIHKIVDAFARQADIPGYARMVSHAESTPSQKACSTPSAARRSSTPTPSTNSSWTTGRKPCRTMSGYW
ncbi:MAG: N-6 DNA methylase [Acidithiobacillus ferriphilus]